MARYIGGPCDGLPLADSFTEPRSCGGVLYNRGADGNYHPDTSASGPVGEAALGAKGTNGWHDLQKAVNESVPTTLRHAHRVTHAASLRLRQRRRLR